MKALGVPPCPPRSEHISRIRRHFATTSAPALFLSGASSTGKHATLLASLPSPAPSITTVDCVQSHSDRLIFAALSQSTPCDLSDFLTRINALPATLLVLLRAERLTTPAFSSTLPTILLTLPTLASRPDLHIVLLSRTPWPVFHRSLSEPLPPPLTLFFPPYPALTIASAITSHLPADADPDHIALFPGFVSSVVEALYPSTNDLPELAAVCNGLFPHYLDAWRESADPAVAATAAFNKVHALLAVALRDLYRAQHGVPREDDLQQGRRRREQALGENQRAKAGLSKASITMIVAAFLAGRNPPATDVKYFTAQRTRRSRKGQSAGAKRSRMGRHSTGSGVNARGFPLERLLAIFEAVRDVDDLVHVDDEINAGTVSAAMSTSTLVQISTLVRLNYLSREGTGDPLTEPKFRCNVSHKQAAGFARLVGIELEQFLHIDRSTE